MEPLIVGGERGEGKVWASPKKAYQRSRSVVSSAPGSNLVFNRAALAGYQVLRIVVHVASDAHHRDRFVFARENE